MNRKMLLFYYQVRHPFSPLIEGETFAKDKADAFNQIVRIYTKKLNTSITELKISIEEVI